MPYTETNRQKLALVPYVDIYEQNDSIVLVADMPGVDEQSAHVVVENGLLTIDGDIERTLPEGTQAVRRERKADSYRRVFEIPDAVDTGNIQARMKHGVLTVTLPRREDRKARKIEICAA